MSSKSYAKSILKQPKPTSTPDDPSNHQPSKAETDKRNLTLALHHATRIQSQKKTQLQILDSITDLLDVPSGSGPTSAEATTLIQAITIFQPSDVASLIEERRLADRCGYALCSKLPRASTLGPSASWKLKGKSAGDFCSTGCLRKALYVKAQLSGVPAWEREVGESVRVVLPEGDAELLSGVGAGGEDAASSQMRHQREGQNDLAAERGDQPMSFRPRQVMMDSVVEKAPQSRNQSSSKANPPTPKKAVGFASGGAIEGYEPRFRPAKPDDSDDDGSDVEREDPLASTSAHGADFSSEIIDPYAGEATIDPEEEAAWRQMQEAVKYLNTGHDR